MDKKFNGTTVETNGVRSIAGGGTGASTAEQARINLGITGGGVTSYNDLTDKPTLGTAAATAASDYATAAQGTDSRTPTAHKSSHATGGDDALSPADIGAEPAISSLPIDKGGTGATTLQQARENLGIKSPEINRRSITGSTTWAKPVGAKQFVIECVAGGGGGGRGIVTASGQSVSGGGGGGSGGYTRVVINADDLPDTDVYTVTVGSGGSGGTTGNAVTGSASNVRGSTLGIFVNAAGGGLGGVGAAAGASSAGSAGAPAGNTGGAGNITAAGGNGTGQNYSASSGGAGGGCGTPSGGSFQPFNGGISGSSHFISGGSATWGALSSTGNGGNGGTAPTRAIPSLVINGGGGGGGGASTFAGATGGNGGNATGFGGGGGGGGSVAASSGSGGNGGNGAPGIVVITTYF